MRNDSSACQTPGHTAAPTERRVVWHRVMPRSAIIWTRSRKLEFKCDVPSHTQNDDLLVKMPSLEQILCRGRFRHPGTYRTIPSLSTVCTRTPQEDDATDFAPICPAVKRLGLQYSYCATFVPLSKPFRSRFTPKKSPSRQARFPSHRDELLGCGRYELLLYE